MAPCEDGGQTADLNTEPAKDLFRVFEFSASRDPALVADELAVVEKARIQHRERRMLAVEHGLAARVVPRANVAGDQGGLNLVYRDIREGYECPLGVGRGCPA